MTFPIKAPPFQAQAPQAAQAVEPGKTDPKAKAKADAEKAGRDFEAILVRQMLSTTKVAGKGGYSDMAIESLAASITAAGGLGMGRAIEDSLVGHRPEVARAAATAHITAPLAPAVPTAHVAAAHAENPADSAAGSATQKK